jgi:TetR/AcrR family transcriptional repressor of nem operon
MPRFKQFDPNEVLEKAIDVFWEKGYHATSMQDLVSNLGINRASIYDTYGCKEELFNKAIKRYQEVNVKRFADFLYQYINVREGLYYLFEMTVLDSNNEKSHRGCFIVNTISELANSNEELKAILTEKKKEVEKVFFNYLQYGVNQGQISPYKDIDAISSYLYAFKSGLAVITKTQETKEELRKSINIGLTVLD